MFSRVKQKLKFIIDRDCEIANCSTRGYQDSESKGSKDKGIQIVSFGMVSRFN